MNPYLIKEFKINSMKIDAYRIILKQCKTPYCASWLPLLFSSLWYGGSQISCWQPANDTKIQSS